MGNPHEAIAHLATLRVQTQLKDPTFTFKGELQFNSEAAVWHDIQVWDTPTSCDHFSAMCEDCSESWLIDHYVRILAPDGHTLSINQVPGMLDISELPSREED